MNDPYETLDVPREATKDAIKRAYRRKAQKAHPDKGGNPDDIVKLNQAYALLSDDSRRERYDKTGADGNAPDDNLLQELAGLMSQVIASVTAVENVDIPSKMRLVIKGSIADLENQKHSLAKEIAKRNKVRERLSVKEGVHNALADVLAGEIASANELINKAQERIARCWKLIERLDDYSYRADAAPAAYSSPFHTSFL